MSSKTKDHKISLCCFCTQHSIKVWHQRLSTCGMLFQWANIIKIQLSIVVSYKVDIIITSSKYTTYSQHDGGRRGRDRMVVGFTTTYALSAYHHWCCDFESRSGRGVQHYV